MHPLILYTTAACHLCEQAECLLVKTLDFTVFKCELVDIAEQHALLQRYGTRIPVLTCDRSGQELNWPFGVREVADFTRQVAGFRT
jgi:hypothetical protein